MTLKAELKSYPTTVEEGGSARIVVAWSWGFWDPEPEIYCKFYDGDKSDGNVILTTPVLPNQDRTSEAILSVELPAAWAAGETRSMSVEIKEKDMFFNDSLGVFEMGMNVVAAGELDDPTAGDDFASTAPGTYTEMIAAFVSNYAIYLIVALWALSLLIMYLMNGRIDWTMALFGLILGAIGYVCVYFKHPIWGLALMIIMAILPALDAAMGGSLSDAVSGVAGYASDTFF